MRYFYYVIKEGDSVYSRCGRYRNKAELISSENKLILFIDEITKDEFDEIIRQLKTEEEHKKEEEDRINKLLSYY